MLPGVNDFFTSQAVELLSTEPFTPVTMPLAAIAGDAGAT